MPTFLATPSGGQVRLKSCISRQPAFHVGIRVRYFATAALASDEITRRYRHALGGYICISFNTPYCNVDVHYSTQLFFYKSRSDRKSYIFLHHSCVLPERCYIMLLLSMCGVGS